MHSSGLRGTDFDLAFQGRSVAHAEFFRDWRSTDRVGLLTPDPTEGLGAATLVLACVTAFYDRYRERKEEFFAYPDYFTFQR
ncbi:MAG: hypothetical protein FJX77_15425, partial [Armatimonadetes bacterium]|nr:hypothetical protein [Armatimonadota bacterium]